MTNRDSDHHSTKVHPLFSLIALPPVFLITKIFSIEPMMAVRVVNAVVASLWIATFFTLLRLIGCRRLDAILFSGLATASASAIFWFVVPETFLLGSLSIMIALCFVVITEFRQFSSLWYICISAFTLSFTVTNWMAGVLITIVNFSKKQALLITIKAYFLVFMLSIIQKTFFDRTVIPFFTGEEQNNYILTSSSGGPLHSLKSFVSHTMVMPAINVVANNLSTQLSFPGSGSPWGMISVLFWIALLGLGVYGIFSHHGHFKVRIVLGLTLLGQLLLHSVYGDETFLYSLHFMPLLIILAAFSTFTRARKVALLLTVMLVLTAGVNNVVQLNKAIIIVGDLANN